MNHRIMKVSRMAQARLNSCTTLEATETNPPEFQPVIGLEMHAQLSTPTKLFSASATIENPNIPSNSFVTKFDMAMPGTLPRLSRSCVEKSLLASILLNCEIADFCRFDRKHYFYPDLPLGYQITQKASPIAKNGHLDFFSQSEMLTTSQTSFEKRRIRIEQIQLEMDSGKTIRSAADDFLDLNRAGLALIEIVTAPNFCSPTEAICFVEHLRILLSENGVCAGLFHEGNLRVDANVSLSRSGQPGNKVELKNLSSITHLHSAISKELDRQRNLLKRGECVQQETRAVDIHGNSVAGREKGAGMDYRFMPEPNLPPLAIQPGWVDMARQQAQLELPHLHFVQRHGFPPLFAVGVLKNTRLGQFIREYHSHDKFVPFAHLLPWLDELEFLCNKISRSFPPVDADLIRCFAELVHLEFQGRLTKLVCIDLLKELASQEGSGDALEVTERIEKRQLWRIADPNEIEGLVQTVITEQSAAFLERLSQLRPEVVGRNRAFAKLKRMVIDKSRKRASPGDVEAAIWRQLGRNLKNH